MKKSKTIVLVFFAIGLFSFASLQPIQELEYPAYWPKPRYDFEKNPLDAAKIELGRRLFYEPLLSENNSISCASCHLSYTAFAHTDHALSHGIYDSIGTRNAPALINLAWAKHFMWDGAINHLDVQALAPISHPSEMGADLVEVIAKLQATENYPLWFEQAFGSKNITGEHLLKALSQFQLTFVSANAKYDQVKSGTASFSEQEEKGYLLFQQHCNHCHQEPLFTNGDFASNGLPVDTFLRDLGRYQITQHSSDSFKFKVPTLRNIAFSYPYMHDGRFKSLYEVLGHYTALSIENKYLDESLQQPLLLTDNERVDLVAFLLTLTDKTFLFNPDFAYPRK